METHLEFALIEVFYAISEFQQLRGSPDWRGDEAETLALDSVLRAIRSMLDGVLARARQIGDEGGAPPPAGHGRE